MLLRLQVRMRNSCLLQRHFRDVRLPAHTVSDIRLPRMAVVLAAILDPRLSRRSKETTINSQRYIETLTYLLHGAESFLRS